MFFFYPGGGVLLCVSTRGYFTTILCTSLSSSFPCPIPELPLLIFELFCFQAFWVADIRNGRCKKKHSTEIRMVELNNHDIPES